MNNDEESTNSIAALLCSMSEAKAHFDRPADSQPLEINESEGPSSAGNQQFVAQESSDRPEEKEDMSLMDLYMNSKGGKAGGRSLLCSKATVAVSIESKDLNEQYNGAVAKLADIRKSASSSPNTSTSSNEGAGDRQVPASIKRKNTSHWSSGYSSLTTTTAEGISESETEQPLLSSKKARLATKDGQSQGSKKPAARPSYHMERDLKPYPYFYYVDRSQEQDDDPLAPISQPLCVPNFVIKLQAILFREDLKHIVCWLPHGRAWKVVDTKEFERIVLPDYFKQSNISSFHRQANGWGFRRMLKGSDKGAFYNENFLRGLPFLCKKMRRVGGAKLVEDSNINHEPNLWKIGEEHPLPEVFPDDLNHTVLKTINKCIEKEGPKAKLPFIHDFDFQAHVPTTQSREDVSGKPNNNCDVANPPKSAAQFNTVSGGPGGNFGAQNNNPMANIALDSILSQKKETASLKQEQHGPNQIINGVGLVPMQAGNTQQLPPVQQEQFQLLQQCILQQQQQRQQQLDQQQQQQLLMLLNAQQQSRAQNQLNQVVQENQLPANLVNLLQNQSSTPRNEQLRPPQINADLASTLFSLTRQTNTNNGRVAVPAPMPMASAPVGSPVFSSVQNVQQGKCPQVFPPGNSLVATAPGPANVTLEDMARQVLQNNDSQRLVGQGATSSRNFDITEMVKSILQEKQNDANPILSPQMSAPPNVSWQSQIIGQNQNQGSMQRFVQSAATNQCEQVLSNSFSPLQRTPQPQQQRGNEINSNSSQREICELVTRAVLSGMHVGSANVASLQQQQQQNPQLNPQLRSNLLQQQVYPQQTQMQQQFQKRQM